MVWSLWICALADYRAVFSHGQILFSCWQLTLQVTMPLNKIGFAQLLIMVLASYVLKLCMQQLCTYLATASQLCNLCDILYGCLRKQVKLAIITLSIVCMMKSLSVYDKVITHGKQSNGTLEVQPLECANKISHVQAYMRMLIFFLVVLYQVGFYDMLQL